MARGEDYRKTEGAGARRARGIDTARRLGVWVLAAIFSIVMLAVGIVAFFTPWALAMWVLYRWVLFRPGGMIYGAFAYGGLFVGGYLLPASLLFGTFSRRLSTRVARLRPAPVSEARPGAWLAIEGRVIAGRATELAGAPPPEDAGSAVERVTYPLVIDDGAGEEIRVESWNGAEAPPDRAGAERTASILTFRVGEPVFAVGELRRVDGAGGYRSPGPKWRLVRGEGPYFGVRAKTQARLVEDLRLDETSPWWGIASLVLIAIGAAAALLAQR